MSDTASSSASQSVLSAIVPNIDLNLQHKDIKLTSPTAVTIRQWISTSYSNNQASFSMPPPSTSIFIDRCFLKKTPVTIAYTGTVTPPQTTLLLSGYDALRAYPIASVTNSDQLTINNQTFVIQTSELVPYMARYWKQTKFSTFPSYLDNYQVYVDGVTGVNNPLGAYLNALDHHQPRGSFPMIVTTNATTGSIQADIFEPVWLPVLHREFDDGLGFTNIRTLDLVSNYSANLARVVSHALDLATLTGVTVTMGQPVVYMKYNTPVVGYVPRPIVYGSQDLNRFVTPWSTLTANSSAVIPSTNMQLNAIPTWVLIFCREANQNLTYGSSDTALNISAVSINFNNVSGVLSSASEHDLFKMSASNGLQDTWEQWHGVSQTSTITTQVGTTGSFLKLYFGKDIMLNAGDYAGKIGAFNLQLNVTVKNVNQSASITSPVLYVITSVPQKVIMHEGGQVESVLGVADVEGEYIPYEKAMKHYGGDFKDFVNKVSAFFKPVVDFLKKHKIISTVASLIPHPIAQGVATASRAVGFGDGGDDGGMTIGGRVATRAELMRRLKNLK